MFRLLDAFGILFVMHLGSLQGSGLPGLRRHAAPRRLRDHSLAAAALRAPRGAALRLRGAGRQRRGRLLRGRRLLGAALRPGGEPQRLGVRGLRGAAGRRVEAPSAAPHGGAGRPAAGRAAGAAGELSGEVRGAALRGEGKEGTGLGRREEGLEGTWASNL